MQRIYHAKKKKVYLFDLLTIARDTIKSRTTLLNLRISTKGENTRLNRPQAAGFF